MTRQYKQLPRELLKKFTSPYRIHPNPPVKDPCKICIIKITCEELCEEKALFNLFDDGERKRGAEIKISVF